MTFTFKVPTIVDLSQCEKCGVYSAAICTCPGLDGEVRGAVVEVAMTVPDSLEGVSAAGLAAAFAGDGEEEVYEDL